MVDKKRSMSIIMQIMEDIMQNMVIMDTMEEIQDSTHSTVSTMIQEMVAETGMVRRDSAREALISSLILPDPATAAAALAW